MSATAGDSSPAGEMLWEGDDSAVLLVRAPAEGEPDPSFINDRDREALSILAPVPSRRREWLWGRYAVKLLLERFAGIPPGAVSVLSGGGRPELRFHDPALLAAAGGLNVSLAHKGDYFLAGLAKGRRIGVDIETAPCSAAAARALERACSGTELFEADRLSPQKRTGHLLRLWCLKESLVKAGLARNIFDARNLTFKIAPGDGSHGTIAVSPEGADWRAFIIEKEPFCAALVLDGGFSTACGQTGSKPRSRHEDRA